MKTQQLTSEAQEYVGNVMSKDAFAKLKKQEKKDQRKSLNKIDYIKETIQSFRKPLFKL